MEMDTLGLIHSSLQILQSNIHRECLSGPRAESRISIMPSGPDRVSSLWLE